MHASSSAAGRQAGKARSVAERGQAGTGSSVASRCAALRRAAPRPHGPRARARLAGLARRGTPRARARAAALAAGAGRRDCSLTPLRLGHSKTSRRARARGTRARVRPVSPPPTVKRTGGRTRSTAPFRFLVRTGGRRGRRWRSSVVLCCVGESHLMG